MAHENMLYLWSLLVKQVKENTTELKVKRDEGGILDLHAKMGDLSATLLFFTHM